MLPYCNPPLIFAAMKTFILQQVKCCHLYLLLFLNLSSSFISTSVIISHTFFFTTNGCRLLICTALPWCQMSLLLLSSLYTCAFSKIHSINDGKTQQTPDFLPTLTFSDLPFLFLSLSDFSIYPHHSVYIFPSGCLSPPWACLDSVSYCIRVSQSCGKRVLMINPVQSYDLYGCCCSAARFSAL